MALPAIMQQQTVCLMTTFIDFLQTSEKPTSSKWSLTFCKIQNSLVLLELHTSCRHLYLLAMLAFHSSQQVLFKNVLKNIDFPILQFFL